MRIANKRQEVAVVVYVHVYRFESALNTKKGKVGLEGQFQCCKPMETEVGRMYPS